jgi:hypothetical protein
MAFGDIRGTLSVAAASITNPTILTGSAAVSVGDLVYVVVGEQTALTATAVTSSFVTTYTATNAGLDSGTVTGRAFWGKVTSAGTLTSISVAATASADNVSAVAVVIEGPFAASPLDANPALVEDLTSSFTAPATGTLAQASEVVVAWSVNGVAGNWTATSPLVNRVELATATVLTTRIGTHTVSATTTVTPAWTGTAPTDSVIGTNSFMAGAVSNVTAAFAAAGTMDATGTYTPAPAASPPLPIFANIIPVSFQTSRLYPNILAPPYVVPQTYPRTSTFAAVGALATAGTVPVPFFSFYTDTTVFYRTSLLYPTRFEVPRAGVVYNVTSTHAAVGTMASTGVHSIPRTSTFAAVGTLASTGIRSIGRTTGFVAAGTMATAALRTASRTSTFAAIGTLTTAGSHIIPRTALSAAVGTMASVATKIKVGASTFAATGAMSSARIHTIPRTTLAAAAGTMSSVGVKLKPGASTFAAAGTMSSVRVHTIPRTMLAAAVGTMSSARTHTIPRTTLAAAVGTMSSTRTHTIPRTTLAAAVGTMSSARVHTIPRTMLAAGVGTMSAARTRKIPRTTLLAGVGTLTSVSGTSTILNRTSTFAAAATMATAGKRTIPRTSTVAAVGTLATAATRRVPRTALFAGAGTMGSVGSIVGQLARTTAFAGVGTMGSVGTVALPEVFERAATFSGAGSMASVATLIAAPIPVPPPSAIIYKFPTGKSLRSDYGFKASKMRMRTGFRPKIRSGSYR